MNRLLFDSCSIDRKSTRSIERNFQPIKNHKTGFSAEFSGDYSECLKMYQVL